MGVPESGVQVCSLRCILLGPSLTNSSRQSGAEGQRRKVRPGLRPGCGDKTGKQQVPEGQIRCARFRFGDISHNSRNSCKRLFLCLCVAGSRRNDENFWGLPLLGIQAAQSAGLDAKGSDLGGEGWWGRRVASPWVWDQGGRGV